MGADRGTGFVGTPRDGLHVVDVPPDPRRRPPLGRTGQEQSGLQAGGTRIAAQRDGSPLRFRNRHRQEPKTTAWNNGYTES